MFTRPNEPYYILEKTEIPSFFPLSPPILYHDGLHDLFITASTTANNPSPPPPAATAVSEKAVLSEGAPLLTGRRRTVRKDRHSKIYTAQGPRDRRMRLSLDVARKFFDLQDLLGFDKASKTVQWLLNMSKAAIKELVASSKSEFSTSECDEDISTISDNKGKPLPPVPQQAVLTSEESNTRTKRTVGGRLLRSRPLVQPKAVRESRDKARARARERTLEKKMMQCGKPEGGTQGNQKPLVLQAIPFGGFQEESGSHDLISSLELVTEMEENCSTSLKYCKETDNDGSGSIAVSDYNQTVASLFLEPWDMIFTGNIDERIVLSDLQLQANYGRPNTSSN